MKRRHILALAAVLSLAGAAFQVALGIVPSWSGFFGAPESLLARPVLLLTASLAVAVLLVACAAYAASGAGYIRRLPLLRTALVVVGTVFLLRGWVFVPLVLASVGLIYAPEKVPGTALWSSAAFFLLAALYLVGVLASWRILRPHAAPPSN
jgi:hypothetical protein